MIGHQLHHLRIRISGKITDHRDSIGRDQGPTIFSLTQHGGPEFLKIAFIDREAASIGRYHTDERPLHLQL